MKDPGQFNSESATTPAASRRARCTLHGLHYDPSLHSGCVLCRKEATPATHPGAPHTVARSPSRARIHTALQIPEAAKASREARLGARVIDGAFYLAIAAVAIVPMAVVGGAGADEDFAAATFVVILVVMLVGAVGLTVYQWYLIATRGQTIGKQLLKITIVKQDGSPVGFVDGVILRNWIMAALAQFVPFIGLIDAMLIFGKERRCLHDLFATTDVVNEGALEATNDIAEVFR